MEEILRTGQVPDIAAFIDQCRFPGDSLVLVERFPMRPLTEEEKQGSLLQFARLNSGIKPADSTSGRVFSQNFELRWQEEDGKYQVIYLGEVREIPELEPDTTTLATLEKRKEPRYYYLFGEYLDSTRLKNLGLKEEPDYYYYAEVRIPRLLRYPIKTPERRVRLKVCEYVEKATGRTQLFRFQSLEAGE